MSVDLSEDSVRSLLDNLDRLDNVDAVVGDMVDLEGNIQERFKVKRYDLAHSSYSLNYAKDRHQVLDAMREVLKNRGRLAIFTPYRPYGMVEFAKRFSNVPKQVDECFSFGPEVVEPYFRKSFWDV